MNSNNITTTKETIKKEWETPVLIESEVKETENGTAGAVFDGITWTS